MEAPERPPVVGPKAEVTLLRKERKSPENRAYLPPVRKREPHQDGPPAQFISHFNCQLAAVPVDDVRKKHQLEDSKAGGGEMVGEMAGMPGGEAVSWLTSQEGLQPWYGQDGDPLKGSHQH